MKRAFMSVDTMFLISSFVFLTLLLLFLDEKSTENTQNNPVNGEGNTF